MILSGFCFNLRHVVFVRRDGEHDVADRPRPAAALHQDRRLQRADDAASVDQSL